MNSSGDTVTNSYMATTMPWIANQTTLMDTSQSNLTYLTLQDIYSEHTPIVPIVTKYIPPLWYLIGIPGNIVATFVWLRPKMRPSSGCYLAALAMGDTLFLLLHVIFWLQTAWELNLLFFPVICELFPVLYYPSQYINPLLVLGFTLERYIAICHPFRREQWCSTRRAVLVICSLVAISLLLSVIQGYFWQYTNGACDVRQSVTAGGSRSLWAIYSWITDLLIFGVVPIIILVLNLRVIVETNKIKRSEKKMLCLTKGQKIQRKSGASATTFMLLAVSFYLIFTTLPVTILYVLNIVFPTGEPTLSHDDIRSDAVWQRHLAFNTIRTIVERLCISHYACNFYIYLLTGRVFRRELTRICVQVFCKKMSGRIRNTELDDLLATYKRADTNGNKNGVIVAHL